MTCTKGTWLHVFLQLQIKKQQQQKSIYLKFMDLL